MWSFFGVAIQRGNMAREQQLVTAISSVWNEDVGAWTNTDRQATVTISHMYRGLRMK